MWSFRVYNESPTRRIYKKIFVNIRLAKIHNYVHPGHLGKWVKILKFFMFLFHTINLKYAICMFIDPRTIKSCYNNLKLPNTRSFYFVHTGHCPGRTFWSKQKWDHTNLIVRLTIDMQQLVMNKIKKNR